MAETTTKTTTPRRPRSTAAKPAAPRTAAKAKTVEDEATAVDTATPQTLTFSLAQLTDTKNYSVFDISHDVAGNATGCVGKFYAPLGTEVVKIRVEGPMDAAE